MKKSLSSFVLLAGMLLTCCTKEGDTIYKPTPGEKQPATTPLVTVIYGPNSLGDRSYCDLIYKGVEAAAKQYGVRTLQLAPESEEQGLAYLASGWRRTPTPTCCIWRPPRRWRARAQPSTSTTTARCTWAAVWHTMALKTCSPCC